MPGSVDVEGAVVRIAAAADSLDAISMAVEKAAFLDELPGEGRQTLRAARTKLRKLVKEQAAKEAAAASKSLAESSPHAKESYDASEGEALASKYEKLNWRIISKPGGATVKPDEFYILYGYYMQATKGDNQEERPMWAEKGGLDFEGRAKWDAWTAIKGTPGNKAMLSFVKSFYEFPAKALYTDTR
ncbi:TPA: hypothetical protein ACH3X2_008213 [Trebouxia sp. C0005]|nr:MAG: acyl- -binding isoform 2 [Trebouxia sp. A1-2]